MSVLSGIGLGLFLLPGCALQMDEPLDEADFSEISQPLWLGTGAVAWPGGAVTVCFDSGVGTTLRDRVRSLVENSWERAAAVEFTGWATCPSSYGASVKVSIDPSISTPEKPINGKATQGQKGYLSNFVKFSSSNPPDRTIVHEFGHVLGFQDENMNYRTTKTCIQQNQGMSLEGQGDMSRSVMTQSACSSKATLSAWDILGVRSLYGKKPNHSLVGLGGRCATIAGSDLANGSDIIGMPCSELGFDIWQRSPTRTLKYGSGINSMCLDVPHGTVSSGFDHLNAWQCSPNASEQQFTFEGVDWLAMGDRCVEAEAALLGARLSIQHCDQAVSRQKWDFFRASDPTYSYIRLNGTNFCAEVPNSNTALGTELRLATCSGAANQVFKHSTGHISFTDDRCLGVSGGTITNGNRIVLWNGCYLSPPTINEQFTIRGPVKALGQCVSWQSSSPYDGIPVGMTPCSGALLPQQVWEYFW